MSSTKPLSLNGSCLRTGIQESDTGDSGEESEPTYRHYDHFETDVCLTQDEDDDDDPLVSSSALIRGSGTILGSGSIVNNNSIPRKHGDMESSRDGVLGSIRENDSVPGGDGNGGKRPTSSDSDSLTESEATCTGTRDAAADDTTTATSTSESEETQIWVPLSKRPSLRQAEGSMTPRFGGSVSNCSDSHPPQSLIHKTHSASPDLDIYTGGRTITVSAGGQTIISDGQLESSRDTWNSVQAKRQSSTAQRRVTPPQQLSLGLLRHDESMGTITLDISNMINGNAAELRYGDGRSIPIDGTTEGTSSSPRTARRRTGAQKAPSRIASMSDCLGSVCSGLYMLLLVVAGLVVPVAEIFADQKYISMLEGFYLYLHLLSIVCLAHAYIYILRMRALVSRCRGPTVSASRPGRMPVSRDTGSFCIRLGAVGFGIGSMIKSGLHFGEYFEMTSSPFCSHVLFGIRPLLHLCFTFIQLYFVFLNSKMLVYQYTVLARFVLMHMVATNMAVWFEAVVKEILRGLRQVGATDVVTNVTTPSMIYANGSGVRVPLTLRDSGCYGEALMAEVVTTSSPFLYPCTVIYSLVCGSILFAMWLKLGHHINNGNEDSTHGMSDSRSALECSSSSRGLFLGLIILVETVIVLITFFVLARTTMFADTAISLDHAGDIVNFVVTIIAIVLAFYRMHGFEYKRNTSYSFETVLLVISLVGVYLLSFSYIIAAALSEHETHATLMIMSNVLRIAEGTLQTVFLMSAIHRCVSTQEQENKKPGREFIMFLLICNLALLGKTIFEVQRSDVYPTQARFYGGVVWSIISKVTVPLSVLFRFLSAMCMANIWKTNWKQRISS